MSNSLLIVLYCPFCGTKLLDPNESNFCNKCGSGLRKECKLCKCDGFWDFCLKCGGEMKKKITTTTKNSATTNNTKVSSDLDDSNDTTDQEEKVIKSSGPIGKEVRVKVNIVKGDDLKPISQENGGGWRIIKLKEDDDFKNIFEKIKDIYFPKSGYTSLGSPEVFKISLLDFNKRFLTDKQLTELSAYLKTHGLSAVSKPLFYLHLTKCYIQHQHIEKETTKTTLTQITTVKQETNLDILIIPEKTSNNNNKASYVNSFNKSTNVAAQTPTKATIASIIPQCKSDHKRTFSSSSDSSSSSSSSFVKQQKLVKKTNRKIEMNKKKPDESNDSSKLNGLQYKPPTSKETSSSKPSLLPTPSSNILEEDKQACQSQSRHSSNWYDNNNHYYQNTRYNNSNYYNRSSNYHSRSYNSYNNYNDYSKNTSDKSYQQQTVPDSNSASSSTSSYYNFKNNNYKNN